jgi:hypothetical protein
MPKNKKNEPVKPNLQLGTNQKEEKPASKINFFGNKAGKDFLVGGSARLPIGEKTSVSLGYNKVLGEEGTSEHSINLFKETKNGGNFSVGYNSNKEANASYTTPKGNSFSARYSPIGGAIVSARINLGKKKNK